MYIYIYKISKNHKYTRTRERNFDAFFDTLI